MQVSARAMPIPPKQPALARNAAGFLIALATVGCGRLDRVGECRALARTANPALDGIEALSKKDSYDGYRAAAAEYTRLVERLRALPHSARGAKELATDYADTLAGVPQHLSEYALAVRDGDAARRDAAARELEQLSRRERALATRIASYCAGR